MRSRVYDLDFRDKARRVGAWGATLLAVATMLWIWCVLLLITPYQAESVSGRSTHDCKPRLLTESGTANDGLQNGDTCANERDWPEAVLILGLSVPVAVVGTTLFTIGTVSSRMSAHAEAMRELDGLADAGKA
ncbi:hypothetical protein [Streptomyces roseicoloratus]|uniref:Uncharacterized protein n=1 Tax=Streptomyces roseicoloratus TaxID=2508722 RepID=A0ABY9RQV2_9ACTN|nr:hypothetical protein [Streptomyces roseicoloratus]WMX43846.1 hypothetical protein RGF97_01775 [Streptomyces roseicoloratus]